MARSPSKSETPAKAAKSTEVVEKAAKAVAKPAKAAAKPTKAPTKPAKAPSIRQFCKPVESEKLFF